MQDCDFFIADLVLPLTPIITVLRMKGLRVGSTVTHMLSCAPLLRHVEVDTLGCRMWESVAPQTLQALRSLPQSITWQPLELRLVGLHAQSTVQEVCAAFDGTPLAQAVSGLALHTWEMEVEAPIAALHATFPNVLHFCALELPSKHGLITK